MRRIGRACRSPPCSTSARAGGQAYNHANRGLDARLCLGHHARAARFEPVDANAPRGIIRPLDLSGLGEVVETTVQNLEPNQSFTWLGYEYFYRYWRHIRRPMSLANGHADQACRRH